MKLSGFQQYLEQRRSYLGSVIIIDIFDNNNIIIIILSASIITLAMFVGSLLGGYCGGRFGPRLTTLLTCLPSALGWLGMALSPSLSLLMAGRVLCGVSSVLAAPNCSLLVAQFSSSRYRGAALSLFGLMVQLGILLCYCLGAGLYWRWVALVPTGLYILLFLLLLRVPESPLWLLGSRPHQAGPALQWLRQTEDVSQELEELRQTMENQSQALTMRTALSNLSRPDIWKPFLLIITNFYFVNFSGTSIIIFYAVEIFHSMGTNVSDHLAAIITASISVLGGVVGIFLVQKLPRVRLSMILMTVMGLAMATLGLLVYLKSNYPAYSSSLSPVQLVAVTVYMFSYGAGPNLLLWVFLAELLPREYKVLSGIIVAATNLPVFLMTKIYPTLLQYLAPHTIYWLLASVSLSSNIFYAFLMPETRGLTPLEVKQIFSKSI